MYRSNGRLDRELIDWRAGALISDLYRRIYEQLENHPIVETIRLLERLHSVRGAVHGLNPGMEPVHPDGLWADLGDLCEQAGWELSRLELALTKARTVQGQRLEDIKAQKVQERRLEDMGGIADQVFGEADL